VINVIRWSLSINCYKISLYYLIHTGYWIITDTSEYVGGMNGFVWIQLFIFEQINTFVSLFDIIANNRLHVTQVHFVSFSVDLSIGLEWNGCSGYNFTMYVTILATHDK